MAAASSGRPRRKRRASRRGRNVSRGAVRRALVVAALLFAVGVLGGVVVFALRPPEASALPGPRRALQWPGGIEARSREERQMLGVLGVDADSALWRAYRALVARDAIPPGDHWLPSDIDARRALDYLTRSPRRPAHRVVLAEGLDRFEIAGRLQQADICGKSAFLSATRDEALLADLAITGDSAEGFLFPDTYELYENSAPRDIVIRLVATARGRIAKAAKDLGLGDRLADRRWERETVILASLVEKEAARASERRTIAGVFLNRLTDPQFKPSRMLQTDPSAAYGCKLHHQALPSCAGHEGGVTPTMVRDSSNPYNTYRHPGLPPGPIANPGEGALRAAMKPLETDYYFFFARGDGTHVFSRTHADHLKAIAARK